MSMEYSLFVYIPVAGKDVTPRLSSFINTCDISSGLLVMIRNSIAEWKPFVIDSFVLLSIYDSKIESIRGNKLYANIFSGSKNTNKDEPIIKQLMINNIDEMDVAEKRF